MKNIEFQDIIESTIGVHLKFRSAKEKQKVTMRNFLVPNNIDGDSINYADIVRTYVALVRADTGLKKGVIFRGCPRRNKYIKSPMGINVLAKVGKDMATFLKLDRPESYTGHCFR